MSVITFERQKIDQTDTYTATISIGSVINNANDFYIPITLDEFQAPDITLNSISAIANSNKLTSTIVNRFENIRVGDIVDTGVVFASYTPASVSGIVFQEDSNIAIYPVTLNSTTLGMYAGDTLQSNSLNVGTTVDKIDYVNHLIYLSDTAIDSGVDSVTVVPPVRVTAKNTANTELTLSRNISNALTDSSVTFVVGAKEALLGVIKVSPVGSESNSNLSIQVSAYKNTGVNVIGTANGVGVTAPQNYPYINLGNVTMNADEFLLDARVPRA